VHPGVSVLFSYYPVAQSEVECRACTREMHRLHLSLFPFLSVPLLVRILVPLTVRTLLRAFVCSTLPLFWDRLPLGYDFFSLSPSFSLAFLLSLSPPLPPLLHRLLPSLSRLVELFFVCRASLLYRCYAPTTASGEPTGERVTTRFAPNYDCSCTKRSSFIARCL